MQGNRNVLCFHVPGTLTANLDEQTTRAIEALDSDDLPEDSACGRVPIGGLRRLYRYRRDPGQHHHRR